MMNLNNLEKDWDKSHYKCNKCRDLTFIINDGVATPCECRAVKEAKDILRKSGISEEFRNKNFENFKTRILIALNIKKERTKLVLSRL